MSKLNIMLLERDKWHITAGFLLTEGTFKATIKKERGSSTFFVINQLNEKAYETPVPPYSSINEKNLRMYFRNWLQHGNALRWRLPSELND